MSKYFSFDFIRYVNNIKSFQVPWCSQYHFEFTATFLLFYLFDCKLVDLMLFFSFLQGKIDTPEKFGCPTSDAHIVQAYNCVAARLREHPILKHMLNLHCICHHLELQSWS